MVIAPSFKEVARWEVRDLDGQLVAQGEPAQTLDAGILPIGWYKISGLDDMGKVRAWTTAAVLKRLAVPTPTDSPVGADTANAWFTRTGKPEGDLKKMASFASLAALAGVNSARDRLSWGEVETDAGVFRPQTRYDDSARLLREAGLQVLQVFHHTPVWAREPQLDGGEAGKRFPRDLRHQYRFCQTMAARFQGTIQAWEPWNEANITHFGGHTIDEMAALQKASWLGFKAGDPTVTVCWNVYAGSGSKLHTQGVLDNEAWPYFDTYNIHSYSGVERYADEFATAREGACGKPLWISECGIHVRWEGDLKDLPEAEETRQARFVPKSYASSLFAGVSRHYFFILGHYTEGQVQFGLLRHDLTPRRGYLALAAAGRLLAGARPLGRFTNAAARVYAFRAQPDGVTRDVLVAWCDKGSAPSPWPAGRKAEAVFDGYGRPLAGGLPRDLTEAPIFAVLPEGESAQLGLQAPLKVSPAPRAASVSPVVMQVLLPQSRTQLDLQAYRVEPGVETAVPLAIYNFGKKPASGTLKVAAAPAGWRVAMPGPAVQLSPMERRLLEVKVFIPTTAGRSAFMGAPIALRGALGQAGEPALSFRLACDPSLVEPARETPIASAARVEAWSDNIVSGSRMTHLWDNGRLVFTMDFGDQDPWGYPRLKLAAGERPPPGTDGLRAEIEVIEGRGTLRAQFLEEGGAAYLCDLPYDFARRGRQTLTAFFQQAKWGGHSRPDTDGKLSATEINGVMIGINAEKRSRVRLAIGAVRWVKF